MDDYLELARKAGFENVTMQKQKPILIPDNILLEYLTVEQLKDFVASGTGIFSITVYAEKQGPKRERAAKPKASLKELVVASPCCAPGSGCC